VLCRTDRTEPAPQRSVLGRRYHAGGKGRPGRVEIISDANNRSCIPSVVSFGGAGDDTPVVGPAAKAQAQANARNTLYDAKRFIGKPWSAELAREVIPAPRAFRLPTSVMVALWPPPVPGSACP
jgi:hypothetical protein